MEFFGGPQLPPPAPTLASLPGLLVGSVMGMQGSEMPPPATMLAASKKQEAAYTAVMAKWNALRQ